MPAGRPLTVLELTPAEHAELARLTRRHKTAQQLAFRARIILACAAGQPNRAVATQLATTPQTVCKWRRRFVERRLGGLLDEPRSGAPRRISDAQVEDVVVRTLESTPAGQTHWSTRELAKATGLGRTTISEIWQAFRLQPQRSETFALSRDPFLIDKIRDVVGLYMNPPEHAVVFCVDEKSQIQALDRSQPLLPMRPGQAERQTATYARHGTTSLFAALDIRTGQVLGQCHRRHRAVEFRRFLDLIDATVPADQDVHLVMDNYATHKTKRIRDWLAKRPRFHIHFTPTQGSWLNQVERWFADLTTKALRRGVHRSVRALETAIRAYLAGRNADPKPFVWVRSADEILASLARFAGQTLTDHPSSTLKRTSRTGH